MITSVIRKSKPINFLIVFFIALTAFFIATSRNQPEVLNLVTFFKGVLQYLGVFFSIFLLNFIVDKNNLSLKYNYGILVYSLFLLLIPQTTIDSYVLISNVLILFSFRKMLSMYSKKKIKKKIFDAALLIGVASLFYYWSILYLILLFVTLYYYSEIDIKNWIIPLIGVITVYIIATTGLLLVNEDFISLENVIPKVSLDLSPYNSLSYIVGITMLCSFGMWSSLFYLKGIRKKKRTFRPRYKIVFIATLLAAFIIIISPRKSGSEFLFLFAPLAIIITNYIETIKDKWFKEMFLWCMVLLPVILLVL